jgi:hypothetical protein
VKVYPSGLCSSGVNCSQTPEGGEDEGYYYYYTPMTYHCYHVGPRDMLAGCHIRQAHWTTRGSLLRCQSVCVNCSRAPEGGQDEGYYYTPMTYHCYQMGPRGS